jgi:uncharacterized protein YceK
MSRGALAGALVLAALCAAGGCGTIMNFKDDPMTGNVLFNGPAAEEVYGGVAWDVTIAEVRFAQAEACAWGEGRALLGLLGVSTLVFDLPLSAIADTVTLPRTLSASLAHSDAPPPPRSNDEWRRFWMNDQPTNAPNAAPPPSSPPPARAN